MDLLERLPVGGLRHPWELARARSLARLIGMNLDSSPAMRWLDVGSGDGWLAQRLVEVLRPGADLTCWDVNYDAETMRRLATTASGHTTFTQEAPLGAFDVVLLLDVLEHVEDDASLLKRIVEMNASAHSTFLVTVPAYGRLYTQHDLDLRHHRRYEPRECRALLRRSGLDVVKEGGLFASLLVGRWLGSELARLRGRSVRPSDPAACDPGSSPDAVGLSTWRGGPVATRVVTAALSLDGAVGVVASSSAVRIPGLSYFAWCRLAST